MLLLCGVVRRGKNKHLSHQCRQFRLPAFEELLQQRRKIFPGDTDILLSQTGVSLKEVSNKPEV